MSPSKPAIAWRAVLCIALLVAAGASMAAGCPPGCVVLDSIVHAAGAPPDLNKAVQRIAFEGDKLTADGRKAAADVARQVKGLSGRAVAELKVSADSGLAAAAAKAQLQARRAALSAALAQSGLPAAQFRISAD